MRTPRELLLHRHRGAEPALDEVRGEALRVLTSQSRREVGSTPPAGERLLGTLWQELFVTCRRYWMGLGVAWCVIVILAAAGGMDGSSRVLAASVSSEPVIQAMREQERLRDELLGVPITEDTRTIHRSPALGPRSETAVGVAEV